MDILDIDEVLKDDSFCLMEADDEQEDINTILQQWRQNGCATSDNAKVDTRTFTRPKRRSVQNLEPSFALASRSTENTSPNVHLRVGGLVTSHMQKSFLQDTSPPSSILSSMDASSIDRLGNSLITSGDFTNVSFFKTTDVEDVLAGAQIAGYNFDDVIKDRKALENLSLSGDSAIIKDCNIAQIDEMTYLSKTHSGNSTMQNSTESMPSCVNDTFTMLNQTTVVNGTASPEDQQSKKVFDKTFSETGHNTLHDDLISDTVMTLIDSTHVVQPANVESGKHLNLTFEQQTSERLNETRSKTETINASVPNTNNTTVMNRTYHKEQDGNETFDMLGSPATQGTPESPVNLKASQARQSIPTQSTPHRNAFQNLRTATVVSHTPPFQCIIEDDVNISPIVPASKNQILDDEFQIINETKPYSDKSIDQLEKYIGSLTMNFPNPQEHIEDIQEENGIENDSFTELENFSDGIELLADEKNEQKFDDMLEKLSKSSCLQESIRMRQSIDNIKKKHALLMHEKSHDLGTKSNESSAELCRNPSESMCKSSLSSSSSSERLLSRRSRLYDGVQVMKCSLESENKSVCADDSQVTNAKTDKSIASNSSYSVESKTETLPPQEAAEHSTQGGELSKQVKTKSDRNRDPERFKTIRIFKKPTDNEIVVPCIDGEIEENGMVVEDGLHLNAANETHVIADSLNSTRVFNNNKSEVEPNITYQTYKKPKSLMKPASIADPITVENVPREVPKPRALSRPKYISGIARRDGEMSGDFLPKANSASDIHKTYNPNSNSNQLPNGATAPVRKLSANTGPGFGRTPMTSELKSPMGTKAKSFTNLVGGGGNSSFGFSSSNRLSLAKPNSQPLFPNPRAAGLGNNLNYKEKNDRSQLTFRPTSNRAPQNNDVDRDEKTTFKVPPPVSNLRSPNSRRTGLARPSSGFYGQPTVRSDSDLQTGRYSSNNSLSSTSSKGSAQDSHQPMKCTNGYLSENSTSNEEIVQTLSGNVQVEQSSKLTAPTAKTGIPKPSGLRPPSNVRRSGLPRPSSIVRR